MKWHTDLHIEQVNELLRCRAISVMLRWVCTNRCHKCGNLTKGFRFFQGCVGNIWTDPCSWNAVWQSNTLVVTYIVLARKLMRWGYMPCSPLMSSLRVGFTKSELSSIQNWSQTRLRKTRSNTRNSFLVNQFSHSSQHPVSPNSSRFQCHFMNQSPWTFHHYKAESSED